MSLTHYFKPKAKIIVTHSGTDYNFYPSKLDIWIQENAADNMEFTIPDEGADIFDNKMTYNDIVQVWLEYQEVEDPLTVASLRFYGFIEDITPYLSLSGEVLNVKCRSYARCLLDLLCGEQYGAQSTNSSLDTLKEIIQDIIPNWINKLLKTGSAGSSGYSLDYSLIEDISGTINYLYNTFKPGKDAISDIVEIISAIKGSESAGAHWIVKPVSSGGVITNYFLLATVGNHPSSPNILAKWPNWWNPIGDTEEEKRASSTIAVKQDMIIQQFTRQRPEANYILYNGHFIRPSDGDYWTEDPTICTTKWHPGDPADNVARDTTNYKVGAASVQMNTTRNDGAGPYFLYYYGDDSINGLSIDVTKIGGRYSPPNINFFTRKNVEIISLGMYLGFNMAMGIPLGANSAYRPLTVTNNTWCGFTFQIGPYQKEYEVTDQWIYGGTPDWTDLDVIALRYNLAANANAKYCWIDGLNIQGQVLRGAKKLTAGGSAESYYKIKPITDNIGKDDVLKATDDSGTIGRLAHAELLRASRRPITGTIQIPGKPSILAGQKAHIHAVKTTAGAFRIDKDMRIIEHHLNFTTAGLQSYLTLTDDILNGNVLSPYTAFNIILKAVSPEFQNRQIGSIKVGDIDITIPILEKTYSFNDYYP